MQFKGTLKLLNKSNKKRPKKSDVFLFFIIVLRNADNEVIRVISLGLDNFSVR